MFGEVIFPLKRMKSDLTINVPIMSFKLTLNIIVC